MSLIAPHLTPAAHKQPAQVPLSAAAAAELAHRIADRAVVSDIETGGVPVGARGDRVYDIRPMTDLREHAPESVDMAWQELTYGLARGLIKPAGAGLVRIVARP